MFAGASLIADLVCMFFSNDETLKKVFKEEKRRDISKRHFRVTPSPVIEMINRRFSKKTVADSDGQAPTSILHRSGKVAAAAAAAATAAVVAQ